MGLKEKLEKVDFDIDKGRKFKAADRLRNLIQENPHEMELWNKLAQLYYEGGFLDAAGRYWILTEPTNDRIKNCVEVYEKSVNYSGYQILQDLVFRGDKSKLPKYAQKKLAQLEIDSSEKSNCIPKFAPRTNKANKRKNTNDTSKEKFGRYLIFAVLIGVFLLILTGFGTVIEWIFG